MADKRGLGIPPQPAFTFTVLRQHSCESLTRACARLLGPCFTIRPVSGQHRRWPHALASLCFGHSVAPGNPPGQMAPHHQGWKGGGWGSGRALEGAAWPPQHWHESPCRCGHQEGESAATVCFLGPGIATRGEGRLVSPASQPSSLLAFPAVLEPVKKKWVISNKNTNFWLL